MRIFLTSRKWLTGLLLVNLAGFLFGLYYYWYQLTITPPWTWLFIIDCPLYVLLFAAICFQRLRASSVPGWLYYLASIGLIKYGIWTGLVVWLYSGYFFSFAPVLYAILFPLHIGMILEGIVLLPWIKTRPWHLALGLVWFLFNDWLDYFGGTLPLIPETFVPALMWESFAASILLSFGVFFWRYRNRKQGLALAHK